MFTIDHTPLTYYYPNLIILRCSYLRGSLAILVEGEPLLLFGEIAPELSEPLRMKTLTDEDLFVDIPVGFSNDRNGGGKREDNNVDE